MSFINTTTTKLNTTHNSTLNTPAALDLALQTLLADALRNLADNTSTNFSTSTHLTTTTPATHTLEIADFQALQDAPPLFMPKVHLPNSEASGGVLVDEALGEGARFKTCSQAPAMQTPTTQTMTHNLVQAMAGFTGLGFTADGSSQAGCALGASTALAGLASIEPVWVAGV